MEEEEKKQGVMPGMAVNDGAGMVVDDAKRRVDAAGGVEDMNDRIERQQAVMPLDEQIRTLREMSQKMNLESDEERARRERRERSRRIVSAVGDGVRALSNMWFTHRYAPDAYDHRKTSMLAAEDARIEKARGERERDRDRWLNYSLKIGDLEGQKARTLRELEDLQQRRKLARQKAQADAERLAMERALHEPKMRKAVADADRMEYEAEDSRVKAANAPDYYKSRTNRNNRTGIGRSRSGTTRKYYGSLPDENGDMVAYWSKADYEAALNEPWRNITPDRSQQKVNKSTSGRRTRTTTTVTPKAKSSGEKAGEAMAAARERKKGTAKTGGWASGLKL